MYRERKFWIVSVSMIFALLVTSSSLLGFEYWKMKSDVQKIWKNQMYASVTDEFLSSNEKVIPRKGINSEPVYLPGVNKVVELSADGYVIYSFSSQTPKEIVSSDSLLKLQAVSDSQVGYLSSSAGRNTLIIENLSDDAQIKATDQQGNLYNVQDWVPVSNDSLVFQEAGTNFMYLYNLSTQKTKVIGKFDAIGGAAGEGQAWFHNSDSKDYFLYSDETSSTTNLVFPGSGNHIVTQITRLPSGDVLWRYTGLEDDVKKNTQSITLQTKNGYHRTIYEGLQQAEQFTHPVQYNIDGTLLAVAVQNPISGPSVLIIDSRTGDTIDQVPVNLMWFVS